MEIRSSISTASSRFISEQSIKTQKGQRGKERTDSTKACSKNDIQRFVCETRKWADATRFGCRDEGVGACIILDEEIRRRGTREVAAAGELVPISPFPSFCYAQQTGEQGRTSC